jgi:hypothetical protein
VRVYVSSVLFGAAVTLNKIKTGARYFGGDFRMIKTCGVPNTGRTAYAKRAYSCLYFFKVIDGAAHSAASSTALKIFMFLPKLDHYIGIGPLGFYPKE